MTTDVRPSPGIAGRIAAAIVDAFRATAPRAVLGGLYVALMSRLVGRGMDVLDAHPHVTSASAAAGWTVLAAGLAWSAWGLRIAATRRLDPFLEIPDRVVAIAAMATLCLGGAAIGAPLVCVLGLLWSAGMAADLLVALRIRRLVAEMGIEGAAAATERSSRHLVQQAFGMWDLRDRVADELADRLLCSIDAPDDAEGEAP